MVNLFRRRKKAAKSKEDKKKKNKQTETTDATAAAKNKQSRKKKASSKAAAVLPRSLSKEYSSPLTTIAETHDEEGHVVGTPETERSVLQSINVVKSTDESMEVVVGSATSNAAGMGQDMTSEPDVLLEQVHVFDKKNATDTEVVAASNKNHDDIRKALFQGEEDVAGGNAVAVSPEEPPFDVQTDYGGEEDPAILDMTVQRTGQEEQPDQSANSVASKEQVALLEEDKPPPSMFKSDIRDANITKKLLAAFNCTMDTTDDVPACKGMSAFYDTMCTTVRGKRPFFSEEFTRDFLEDAVKDGVPLMYHYEAKTEDDPDASSEWKGHSVTMFVRQGSYQGSQIVHPRLEWPSPEQQWTTETPGTINLMDIQSISDSSQDNIRDDLEADTTEVMDLCFFSITSKDGQVYLFESASPAERDWIVTGLKNIIVRLSYHLIVGDPAVSSELFGAEYEYGSGDLPTLKTPVQAMNEVAHAFLD